MQLQSYSNELERRHDDASNFVKEKAPGYIHGSAPVFIDPELAAFTGSTEFIGLGCFCAVARALQMLGVRRHAYPFDWVRSDVRGVIHCLDAMFEDFLTFKSIKNEGGHTVFTGCRWGGSFWHHNIRDAGIISDMTRRAERLLGMGAIPPSASRAFVCAVNSTSDINNAIDLRDALRRVLPDAPFKLLFIIDCQKQSQAFQIDGADGADILFYHIDQRVYETRNAGDTQDPLKLNVRAEPFVDAIKFAIMCWAGKPDAIAAITSLPGLLDIGATCKQWHGGDPANELFSPVNFTGQRMKVGNVPSRLPHLAAERVGHFQVPVGTIAGQEIECEAFGMPLRLKIPTTAVVGQVVELRLAQGVVESTLLATTTMVGCMEHRLQ